jgi:hypothetical protein
MTLVTFAQVDSGVVTADMGEIGSAPVRVGETQDIDVVSNAARQVRDIQDRFRTLKSGSLHRLIFLHMPVQIKAGVPVPVQFAQR